MNKRLCIYHGNCADGFGAAWVVRNALGDENVEFHAGVYGKTPPDVTARDVIMVDFSYKRPVLLEMAAKANSILILDHHKTAQEDLIDLPANVTAVFDMKRSGAMIAWDYYNPDKMPLPLIRHIQDRDLWTFKLPGTREIQSAVFSYPYEFKQWTDLMEGSTDQLYRDGLAIERKHHKDVAELVKMLKRRVFISAEGGNFGLVFNNELPSGTPNNEQRGYIVWAASIPYTMTSDAGDLMCDGDEPFAACYWDTADARIFSLRSRFGSDNPGKSIDVSVIAKQYGGGGHAAAAGFQVPRDHPLARM